MTGRSENAHRPRARENACSSLRREDDRVRPAVHLLASSLPLEESERLYRPRRETATVQVQGQQWLCRSLFYRRYGQSLPDHPPDETSYPMRGQLLHQRLFRE